MKVEARERLAAFVKRARGKRSQRAFSRMLDVSPTAVQDWEKGAVIPDVTNLSKIAISGGLTLEQLMEHLETGKAPKATELERILKKIGELPTAQVAEIVQAGCARLAAECAGIYGE